MYTTWFTAKTEICAKSHEDVHGHARPTISVHYIKPLQAQVRIQVIQPCEINDKQTLKLIFYFAQV